MSQLSDRDRARSSLRADELPESIRTRGNQAIDELIRYLTSLFDGDTDVPQEHPYFLEVLNTMRMGPEWNDRLLAHGYERTSIKWFLKDVAVAVKRNPLYVVLAAEIVATTDWKKRFFPADSEQMRADLKRSVTYGVLLDMVTHVCLKEPMRAGPSSPPTFVKQLYDHIVVQRKEIDWKPYSSAFMRIKSETMQIGIGEYTLPYKENYPQSPQVWQDGSIISVNLLEAVAQDLNLGYGDNAHCGTVLMRHPINRQPVEGLRNGRSKVRDDLPVADGVLRSRPPLPREWGVIYSSWNMAFASAEFSYSPCFFATLLHPTTAGAYHTEDEGLFLVMRGFALWFHLHWLLFDNAERKSKESRGCDWRNKELTALWGSINKAAAISYDRRVQETLDKHHPTPGARAKAEAAIHVDFEQIWVMTKLISYFTGSSKELNLQAHRARIIAMIDKYQPPSMLHRCSIRIRVCWSAMMSLLGSSRHGTTLRLVLVAVSICVVAIVLAWIGI